MAEEAMVSSGADLASSFTPDSGAPSEASGGVAIEEAPVSPDTQAGDEIDLGIDEIGVEEPPEEEATPEEPPASEVPPEELPEGVRKGKDRKGKDGFWLEPHRYELFHGAHKTLRSVEDLIGEPFSIEAIQLRDRAYMGQERLYNDFLSGVPEQQGKVIQHLFDEARRARQEGEIAVDPLVPFTEQFYTSIQKSNPEAYAVLRRQAANDLVDEMYAQAAEKGNRGLWLSAQHFDKTLGRKWKPEVDMANYSPEDPVAILRAENERLRHEILTGTASASAEQQKIWQNTVNRGITKTVTDDVVLPALESVKKSYAEFPDTWASIQERLHSRIVDGFKQDERFQERVKPLMAQAKRAVSAQRRQEIAEQIQMLHRNKAKLIVEAHKPQILREAAVRLKEQSDASHKRHQAAQTKQAPAGGGTSVQRSLAPVNGKDFDFEVATPEAMAASLRNLFKR